MRRIDIFETCAEMNCDLETAKIYVTSTPSRGRFLKHFVDQTLRNGRLPPFPNISNLDPHFGRTPKYVKLYQAQIYVSCSKTLQS